MPILSFLGTVIAGYVLSFLVMHALAQFSRGSYKLFRLFLFPGIIVHEASHMAACLLTGTPIQSVSFWTETGGEVIHHKPKLSVITQPLISFAPFPVGMILLLLLSQQITDSPWQLSIIWGLLMISIAATLAPSKTDIVNALEGLVLLAIVIGIITYYIPDLLKTIEPTLNLFTKRLLGVDALLVLMWIGANLLHHGARRVVPR